MNGDLRTPEQYAALGWHILPCIPGQKRPYVKWERAVSTPEAAAELFAGYPGAEIGVLCGPSRLAVIDRDTYKADYVDAPLPDVPSWRLKTPSGGFQDVYRDPDGTFPTDSDVVAKGVDRRGVGGLFIVPSAASPGRRWIDRDRMGDIPAGWGGPGRTWRPAAVDGWRPADALPAVVRWEKRPCPLHENHSRGGDQESLSIGEHEDGRVVVHCNKGGDCTSADIKRRLIAAGEYDAEHFYTPPRDEPVDYEALEAELVAALTSDTNNTSVSWTAVSASGDYAPDPDALRYDWLDTRFSTVEDVLSLPPIQWLVPGLLQVGATAQIVGPSTGGKSLWTLQTCVRLALEGRRVVYCALEGKNGFNGRLRAQMLELGISDPAVLRNLLFYDMRLNLYGDDAAQSVADLRAGLRLLDADIVVIDTLIRSAPGIKENDSGMMQAVIDHADSLRHRKDVSVWLVHHSGHDQLRGRGSSAVPAAMDNTVFIFPVGSNDGKEGRDLIVKVYSDKIKDGRQSEKVVLKRHEHVLGHLDDGSAWTSVVFRPAPVDAYAEASNLEAKVRGWIEAGVSWKVARNKVNNPQRAEARDIWERLLREGVGPLELGD